VKVAILAKSHRNVWYSPTCRACRRSKKNRARILVPLGDGGVPRGGLHLQWLLARGPGDRGGRQDGGAVKRKRLQRWDVVPGMSFLRPTVAGWRLMCGRHRLIWDPTKAQVLKYAVWAARIQGNVTLRIHGRNGRIQEERTYGADPRRSKG
jgi:hypothetical protein